jgi:hypothetical protein
MMRYFSLFLFVAIIVIAYWKWIRAVTYPQVFRLLLIGAVGIVGMIAAIAFFLFG